MTTQKLPEVWLRGPVDNIPSLLQPVAHALLQAREEVNELMNHFPEERLWVKPADAASAGFHLQHITGVLDRLFTYVNGEPLTGEKLAYLEREGESQPELTAVALVSAFDQQVNKAMDQLQQIKETTLTEYRGVGRAGLPSTVMGLLFHAAEHTMRHLGQLLVTVKIVKAN